MFYSVALPRTLAQDDSSLGCRLSDISEEVFQRGKRGARIYRSFCWGWGGTCKKHVVEHEKITVNHKKTHISS